MLLDSLKSSKPGVRGVRVNENWKSALFTLKKEFGAKYGDVCSLLELLHDGVKDYIGYGYTNEEYLEVIENLVEAKLSQYVEVIVKGDNDVQNI